jgi:AcrR family transcriptional regulator
VVLRTGRRPGRPDTREAILEAAREAFAEKGFDGTTIRTIAAGAGVDPALVHHYFGTKNDLFLAVMKMPVDPGSLLTTAIEGDRANTGHRLVRAFLTVWDGPAGAAGAALLRSAVGSEWTAKLFREFILTQLARRLVPTLKVEREEALLRVSLVASQMAGLAMTRYILNIEPLASASPDLVVASVGNVVQNYLFGPLETGPDNYGAAR